MFDYHAASISSKRLRSWRVQRHLVPTSTLTRSSCATLPTQSSACTLTAKPVAWTVTRQSASGREQEVHHKQQGPNAYPDTNT